MYSLAKLTNTFTNLSQNTSAANQALGIQIMSDIHRDVLEDYFDNERSFVSSTVGAMTLAVTANLAGGVQTATLTGTWNYPNGSQVVVFSNAGGVTASLTTNAASGATSATLSSNWTNPSGTQSVLFGNSTNDVRDVTFTNGSAAISWTIPLTAATTSTTITTQATTQYVPGVIFTNGSTTINWSVPLTYSLIGTTITTQGYQRYLIPANISKITNSTISVGQLKFVPAPVNTRSDWDRLNFLPYTQDFPNYFFIYNGNLEFYPVPSTTGNPITFNYKTRVSDFNTAFLFSDTSGTAYVAGQTVYDYQNGAVTTATVGSTQITGTGTSWNTTGKFPLNVDVTSYNLYLTINPPYGDGIYYLISRFTSDTTLTLVTPISNAPAISNVAHNYSIAQLPLVQEDFQDMIVHGGLMEYFSSYVPNAEKFKQWQDKFDRKTVRLSRYAGQKQVSYNLGDDPVQLVTPTLFPFFPNGTNS